MKKIFALSIAVSTSMISLAQPPAGPAKEGMTFGAKTTTEDVVEINMVAEKVMPGKERELKVKGKVVEVCTEMGCWLKMETAKGKMMVKMKDHAFFVPLDLIGKEVVIDGTAKMTVTSVEELKHYAKDAKKSKEEIDAIKEAKKEIVMQAKGVLVL